MARQIISGRPKLACEITAARIFAARAAQKGEGVDVLQVRTIIDPITPNLMNQNFPDADAIRIVLDDALLNTTSHSKELTLVVPDSAVRVVLLDFDTLPDRKAEADAVVRFRLKKTLPFEIDRAAVSYHAQPNGKTLKVVVAVMMNSVLEEYESVVRGAGYVPGVVLPSTLAALGNVRDDGPLMVVKVAEVSTTIAILNDNKLLFYRTLDHGSASVEAEQLAEDIYPSAVFFQDMYGFPVQKVYIAGVSHPETVAPRLAKETSAQVYELVDPINAELNPGNMPRSALAGVLGALA